MFIPVYHIIYHTPLLPGLQHTTMSEAKDTVIIVSKEEKVDAAPENAGSTGSQAAARAKGLRPKGFPASQPTKKAVDGKEAEVSAPTAERDIADNTSITPDDNSKVVVSTDADEGVATEANAQDEAVTLTADDDKAPAQHGEMKAPTTTANARGGESPSKRGLASEENDESTAKKVKTIETK